MKGLHMGMMGILIEDVAVIRNEKIICKVKGLFGREPHPHYTFGTNTEVQKGDILDGDYGKWIVTAIQKREILREHILMVSIRPVSLGL